MVISDLTCANTTKALYTGGKLPEPACQLA